MSGLYERRLGDALADREKAALGVIKKLHLEYVNSIARCVVENVRRDRDSLA